MKKLLLALSSVCLIPTNTVVLIGCGADKASQQQTVKNNINNFLQDSNESNKLKLDKFNTSKINTFGITYQNDEYQFDNNNLTVDAIKEGLSLLSNSDEQLPLIFNAQQILLDTQSAENETALLVETQDCNIFENNLIYKWNISFYISKFKNDEVVWLKTSEKSVELYAEIVDNQQIVTEEVKTEEVKTEEVKTEEVKTEEVKTEDPKNDEVSKDANLQLAKKYKEILSNWNEDFMINKKTSNTVEELIESIKYIASYSDEINGETIKNSSIKVKDVNTQNHMSKTDLLSAEKYIVEIEFKIGEADLQVTETASFEFKTSDYNAHENSESFVHGCETRQVFKNKDDNSSPKVPQTNELNDSGIDGSDLNENDNSNESTHNIHVESETEEIIDSTSTDVDIFTIYVNEKTKVENVIDMIKEKHSSLSEASITLKDSKNKNVNKASEINFTNYQVYRDETTLVFSLRIEEKILTSDSEQIESAEKAIFNIFDDLRLDKLMAKNCTAKNLKDMIQETDQFKDLKQKIKNKNIIAIKIKNKNMNDIEDSTKLLHGQYHVEISVVLAESNTRANITFKVDVPILSHELSYQLEKYSSDIKSAIVKITTKKDSTENKTKCEDKIRHSDAIQNIFKTDKKVVVESVEIQQQAPYIKGTNYTAKITFCFERYENDSRQQVYFSFIVE